MLINNVSLNINNGDMISIVGPNGSGKSTMVKLISGELKPTMGNIQFRDISSSRWDSLELSQFRSVLPQSNHLSFPFSVLDIVKMGRYPYRNIETYSESNHICETIVDIFDLTDLLDQNYITLSGGEKQRVQLARVLAQIWSNSNYNKLLVLDEPTSFLDISHQCALFDLLTDLNKKGITIIMVLHDLNHALMYSNKMVLLKDADLICFDETSNIDEKMFEKVFNVNVSLLKDNSYIVFNNKAK